MATELLGTVKWFDEAKGYGFLNTAGIEKDIFIHYKHIVQDGYRTLYRNELVLFEPIDTAKGVMATKIKKIPHES